MCAGDACNSLGLGTGLWRIKGLRAKLKRLANPSILTGLEARLCIPIQLAPANREIDSG